MNRRPVIPEDVEDHRDAHWRREGARCVASALAAEQFIEQVGFAACLTDSRRPGPSLYVAVCGRRDAVMPRNVQTDHEASLTWVLKDELLRRGKVYYAKLARGKAMFLAPRMVPHFNAVWGVRRKDEATRLGRHARAILKVLRREWEMGTAESARGVGRDRAGHFHTRHRRAAGGDAGGAERGALSPQVRLSLGRSASAASPKV